jgi:hypothetical protein
VISRSRKPDWTVPLMVLSMLLNNGGKRTARCTIFVCVHNYKISFVGFLTNSIHLRLLQDQQKELKHGLPDYLLEMDKMFQGVCVTGETSYVPGRRKGPQTISSDEDEDGGDTTPQSTPHSSGSKRSSSSLSTRSTGSSPIKKSRSPAVRAMQSNMRELNVILENRTAAQNQIWADRQKREEQLEEQKRARRKRVREMARQLGVAGDSRLWVGVLKLVRSDEDMESFEEADEEGRKCILAHLSGVGN